MLSDTAISSRVDEPSVLYNSMGEGQTTRFGYYVEEGLLKLVKIADDFAVSFATEDVKSASEMIETLKMLYDNLSDTYKFKDLLHDFKVTYEGNINTSLLLVYSFGQDDARIYKFSKGEFQESDYADIGSGKNTKTLAEDMKIMLNTMYVNEKLNNTDPNYYLALVSATLQCYLYHNKYFGLGIGGIITGLFLNYKIHFCRSLEFYMFENDISSGNSVSVINRYNSFFSSSQIGHQRGYINQVLDKEIFNDLYRMYIQDENKLGIQDYFLRVNPASYQAMTAVMLESARKGYWKASPEQLKETAALHAQITHEKGAACTEFVCDNAKLQSFVADNLDAKEKQEFNQDMKAVYEAASANGKDVVLKEKKLTPEQVAQKRTTNGLVIGGVVLVVFIGLVALIKRRKSK